MPKIELQQQKIDLCLAERQYQGWLTKFGFFESRPLNPEHLRLKPQRSFPELGLKILDLLREREGEFVSLGQVARSLYGADGEAEVNRTKLRMSNLRNVLEYPEVIVGVRRLGWAIGVGEVSITAGEFVAMYSLMERYPDSVDGDELAMDMYGQTGLRYAVLVSKHISGLRSVTHKSEVEVKSLRDGKFPFKTQHKLVYREGIGLAA